jgi:hypothetical protein
VLLKEWDLTAEYPFFSANNELAQRRNKIEPIEFLTVFI